MLIFMSWETEYVHVLLQTSDTETSRELHCLMRQDVCFFWELLTFQRRYSALKCHLTLLKENEISIEEVIEVDSQD